MESTEFNWIHLSDLHYSHKVKKPLWPQVEDIFYNDLEVLYDNIGPFDAVIISGDLTQSGRNEEFEGVYNRLQELFEKLKNLGSRNVKFLCVPGNHDLERRYSEDSNILANWFLNDEIRKVFFSEPKSKAMRFVEERFSNYTKFLKTSGLPFPSDIKEGIIPGDFSATMEKNGYRFGFIGLNSAFLHPSDEANKHNTAVDVNQIYRVCDGSVSSWCNENHINMLITHHPPEWLSGADKQTEVHKSFKSDIAPTGRFHAHLFGHVHKSRSIIYSVGKGGLRWEFQGVSWFGVEDGETKRIHGYSAGKIIVGDEKGIIQWWPRKLVKKIDGSYQIGVDNSFILKEDNDFVESGFFDIKSYNANPLKKKNKVSMTKAPQPCISYPKALSSLVGRDEVINKTTTLLKDPKRRLITLLGAPGIGKTTIALAMKEKVTTDFKDGVYFCSFQGVEALDGLIATINAAVAHIQDAREETLLSYLQDKDCLLILDNFEDPLVDRSNVQRFLEQLLGQTCRIKLLVTTREMLGLAGIETVISVNTLARVDSEKLLKKLADELNLTNYLNRGDLQSLLNELGDVPLAIVLAAPNLALEVDSLTEELRNQNLDILCRYGINVEDTSKDQSIAKSYLLSYSKIRDFNEESLFLICSLFPAGLNKADAQRILPALRPQNFQALVSKSLILTADGSTYSMLAPIRTYAYGIFKKMIGENKIDIGIVERWINLCVNKSIEYNNTSHGKGKRAIKELIKERPDMFRVIDYLISKSEQDVLLKILFNLTDFLGFVGITKEVMSSLEKARKLSNNVGDIVGEANCIYRMGDILFREYRNSDALASYNTALPLFTQVGDILGQANCIYRMGDIHFRESRNKDALISYNTALPLFKRVGDIVGQANCIYRMGDIHFRESRNEDALNSYNTALPLFKQVGDIVGEANCIYRMGDIHFRESRNEDALNSYNTALPLFKQVGDIVGEANCIYRMGDIHFRESRNKDALNSYNTALPLFKQVGDIVGEANCIYRMGDIHFRESRNEDALNSYNTALPLFKQVGDIVGEANCIYRMGLCSIRNNQVDAGIENVFKAIELYGKINDKYSIGLAYTDLSMELMEKEGFQEKAYEYKKKGDEIQKSIQLALL